MLYKKLTQIFFFKTTLYYAYYLDILFCQITMFIKVHRRLFLGSTPFNPYVLLQNLSIKESEAQKQQPNEVL